MSRGEVNYIFNEEGEHIIENGKILIQNSKDINYNKSTKIITRKCNNKQIKFEKGIGYAYWKCMKANGDSIAQIDAASGKSDTYNTLFTKSVRAAIHMRNLGVKPGDIISICSYNHLNTCIPFIAAQLLGAIVAPIDNTLSAGDRKHLLNLVHPTLLFISDDCESWIEEAFGDTNQVTIISFHESKKFENFDTFLQAIDKEDDFVPFISTDNNVSAVILFSSGTTGLSKGICLSQNYILWNINSLKFTGDFETFLSYFGFFWTSTIIFISLAIVENRKRLFCRSFDPDLYWTYLEKYKVDFSFMVPTHIIKCLQVAPEIITLPNLKCVFATGGAICHDNWDKLKKILPKTRVLHMYGLTEVGFSCVFSMKDEMDLNKPYSAGYPAPNSQIKIVDIETGKALGHDEVGEIRLKSPGVTTGYYKRYSSDLFDDEGFLKTGDMGYYDEDFCIYITDRLKEMFKYFVWHISPAKLEAILESHPAVQFGVVIGVPHPEDVNHATAVITLQNGVKVTEEDILKYVNDKVDDRFKLRGGVRIVKNLPLTPTGKIARRQVRDMVLNSK